jgi:hypothetical protein
MNQMIKIKQSKTADTRSCDYTTVTKGQLYLSSEQHIRDVGLGLEYIVRLIEAAATLHDHDKLSKIDWFHSDFITGFQKTGWWDNHRRISRHHLLQEDGVPKDVNLLDVIEMIVDCVMAGMARTGTVYPLDIDPQVLMMAFTNTAELLKSKIVVEP